MGSSLTQHYTRLCCRCELDEDNEEYKRFKLLQKAAQWEEAGQFISEDALPAPQDPTATPESQKGCIHSKSAQQATGVCSRSFRDAVSTSI